MMNRLVVFGLLFAASSASAADAINIERGEDMVVFGNCVPSLEVDNDTAEIIDYLQIDLALAFGNGQERIVELKSAYREGVLFPIGSAGRITLKQHLDTSRALGVPCGEVMARKVVRTICVAEGGKPCISPIAVRP